MPRIFEPNVDKLPTNFFQNFQIKFSLETVSIEFHNKIPIEKNIIESPNMTEIKLSLKQ